MFLRREVCYNGRMQNRRVQIGFFSVVVTIVLVLSFFIFKPYIAPLFLSLVFYIVFEPVFGWILPRVRGYKWIASLATVIFIIFVILLPFIFFGFFLFQDARDLYFNLSSSGVDQNTIHDLAVGIQTQIQKVLPIANVDVEGYIDHLLSLLVANLDSYFSSFIRVLIGVIIILLSVFYLYRDGEELKQSVFAFSPLPDAQDKRIFDRVKLAVNSVVRGSLATALAQGMLSGIGFAIFGLPNPFLWGAVTAVMALVPTFGTSLVLIPAAIYL